MTASTDQGEVIFQDARELHVTAQVRSGTTRMIDAGQPRASGGASPPDGAGLVPQLHDFLCHAPYGSQDLVQAS